MRKLELIELENINGGNSNCAGQEASFAVANAAVLWAVFGGPVGMAIAVTAFTLALYNLNNCYDMYGE